MFVCRSIDFSVECFQYEDPPKHVSEAQKVTKKRLVELRHKELRYIDLHFVNKLFYGYMASDIW